MLRMCGGVLFASIYRAMPLPGSCRLRLTSGCPSRLVCLGAPVPVLNLKMVPRVAAVPAAARARRHFEVSPASLDPRPAGPPFRQP